MVQKAGHEILGWAVPYRKCNPFLPKPHRDSSIAVIKIAQCFSISNTYIDIQSSIKYSQTALLILTLLKFRFDKPVD